MLWMLVAAPLASAQSPCTLAELDQITRRAESAFEQLDASGFQAARSNATSVLSCLREPITPTLAAAYHRTIALAAFLERNEARGVESLRAMRSAEPGYFWPTELAPPGHQLRLWDESASQRSRDSTTTLPMVDGGWLTIDGTRTNEAPRDRPYVFQWLRNANTVEVSAYVPTGGRPPALPGVRSATQKAKLPKEPRARSGNRSGAKSVLLGVGVGVGVLGGASLVGSAIVDQEVQRRRDDGELANDLAITNQRLFWGGVGGLTAGATMIGISLAL